MAISTKPPAGFRDFLPADLRLRKHVFGVIEEVYSSYGFEALDTPAMERLDTLLGKYGDEGDQLLFKVLMRGDKLTRALDADASRDTDLADLGLRYDLTVPLARVYAQHRNEFPNVFKRYQIAPVWRADRPQKGRYREFYQCDVDVVGSSSMTVEAEVTSALAEILNRLEFDGFRIHMNHRQILSAMMDVAGVPGDAVGTVMGILDKLDKIGLPSVREELVAAGVASESVATLTSSTEGESTNDGVLAALDRMFVEHDAGRAAVAELREVLRLTAGGPADGRFIVDPHLARGLSYYTGPIFEIRSDDFRGSLGGGGRYDELIGMFMKESVPACGFSLGVERILVLMEDRGMSVEHGTAVDVLVTLFSRETVVSALGLARQLRSAGLRVDVYMDDDKLKKQFKYADQRKIPFVIILGPSEIEDGMVAVKDMDSGEQVRIPAADVVPYFANQG